MMPRRIVRGAIEGLPFTDLGTTRPEDSAAPDRLEPPLVPRYGFRRLVSLGVHQRALV
jgi:hypothetical protein